MLALRILAGALLVSALPATPACSDGEGCAGYEELRDQARSVQDELATCADGDVCVLIAFDRDCTGLLGCGVPVNAKSEARAKTELGQLAKDSLDCDLCARASCGPVTTASCNVTTKRCEAQ